MSWKRRLLVAGGVAGPMVYLSTLLSESDREVRLGQILATSLAWAVAAGSLGLLAGTVIDVLGRRHTDRSAPAPRGEVAKDARPEPRQGPLVTVLVRRDGQPIRLQYATGDQWIDAFEAGTGNMVDRHAAADGIERTSRNEMRIGIGTYEIDPELATRAEVDAFIAFVGRPPGRSNR